MLSIFLITLGAVAVLLLCAVPGFLLIRKKMVAERSISDISKILLFVCQPCLATYTFLSSEYSAEKLKNIGWFALICLGIHAVMLASAFFVFRKKSAKEPIYRILTIATTFGNCAFFGIPIIEALMPAEIASGVVLYTTVYAWIMNVLGWTVGSAIISQDTKYITLKKVFLNPSMIGTVTAFLLFVFQVPLDGYTSLFSMITLAGKMSTPLSMIVMGMRLGTMNVGKLFSDVRIYLTIAVKQFVMPLVAFLLVAWLPLDLSMRQTFFVVCACPAASIVLNFSEILGQGQKEAANTVLLSTILSILTLPIMMLLYPLIV